jgi:hypothetical protein
VGWKYNQPSIDQEMNIKSINAIYLKQRFINRARVSELIAITRFSFRLLKRRQKLALAWLVLLQIALSLIDLVGEFLLGVITMRFWSSHGTGGVGIPPHSFRLVETISLE